MDLVAVGGAADPPQERAELPSDARRRARDRAGRAASPRAARRRATRAVHVLAGLERPEIQDEAAGLPRVAAACRVRFRRRRAGTGRVGRVEAVARHAHARAPSRDSVRRGPGPSFRKRRESGTLSRRCAPRAGRSPTSVRPACHSRMGPGGQVVDDRDEGRAAASDRADRQRRKEDVGAPSPGPPGERVVWAQIDSGGMRVRMDRPGAGRSRPSGRRRGVKRPIETPSSGRRGRPRSRGCRCRFPSSAAAAPGRRSRCASVGTYQVRGW